MKINKTISENNEKILYIQIGTTTISITLFILKKMSVDIGMMALSLKVTNE